MSGDIVFPKHVKPKTVQYIKPEFVDNFSASKHAINLKYYCVYCSEIVIPPVFQLYCGHSVCGCCIDTVRQKLTTCPGTRDKCAQTELCNEKHIVPAFYVESQLKKFKVKCLNWRRGCPVVADWEYVEKHVENCEKKGKCERRLESRSCLDIDKTMGVDHKWLTTDNSSNKNLRELSTNKECLAMLPIMAKGQKQESNKQISATIKENILRRSTQNKRLPHILFIVIYLVICYSSVYNDSVINREVLNHTNQKIYSQGWSICSNVSFNDNYEKQDMFKRMMKQTQPGTVIYVKIQLPDNTIPWFQCSLGVWIYKVLVSKIMLLFFRIFDITGVSFDHVTTM